jgi:hypothetical protein
MLNALRDLESDFKEFPYCLVFTGCGILNGELELFWEV